MSAKTATSSQIILTGPVTWHDWLDSVKKLAKANEIWELVDPKGTDEREPRQKPEKPDVTRIRAGASLTSLTVDEVRIFSMMQKDFDHDRAEYNTERTALANFQQFILTSIDSRFMMYTRKANSVREMVQVLKKRIRCSEKNKGARHVLNVKVCKPRCKISCDGWKRSLTAPALSRTSLLILAKRSVLHPMAPARLHNPGWTNERKYCCGADAASKNL